MTERKDERDKAIELLREAVDATETAEKNFYIREALQLLSFEA